MAKNRIRTDADLKEAAVDVAFEFKMFRQGLSLLDLASPTLGNNNAAADLALIGGYQTAKNTTPSPTQLVTPFRNIEGILIHFRNLIEFFFTERQEKGDLVLAHHFTGQPSQKAPTWAREYGQRCNELLAHLTYRRTNYRQHDEHHWTDILDKCRQMDAEITTFLSGLTPDRRAWFN